MIRRTFHTAAAALLMTAATATTAAAQDGPPLQAALALDVPGADGASAAVSRKLDGGSARVRMRVINRDDGRTATIRLRFRYTIPPDTIALDEIVDRIELQTQDGEGNPTGRIEMDPHEVNLNPNGPRLAYDLTMYRPEGDYEVHLDVYGNYE